MPRNTTKLQFPSELRFDLISKDWVVIATGRAKRPDLFKKEKRKTEIVPKDKCPFCKIDTQEKPILILSRGKIINANVIPKDWSVIVVPNKYPAVVPYPRLIIQKEGEFYQRINAVGFHEVVITKDHEKSLGQFKTEEVKEVIDAYQQRYLSLKKERFINYISIFHNHGKEAGASISHPHSQIITTPLIDADLKKAIMNSEIYFQETKKCVYCQMNEWEKKIKKRIVFENEKFLAVCPFASKSAFEIIISPKIHLPYFEQITEKEKWSLADIFRESLRKLYKGLGDPAYNFYLHTSPCGGKQYPYYHWHWTILPKTATWAGFEIGTRMEISTITPEKAAGYLRKQ